MKKKQILTRQTKITLPPLITAARNGHLDIFNTLLSNGASPNINLDRINIPSGNVQNFQQNLENYQKAQKVFLGKDIGESSLMQKIWKKLSRSYNQQKYEKVSKSISDLRTFVSGDFGEYGNYTKNFSFTGQNGNEITISLTQKGAEAWLEKSNAKLDKLKKYSNGANNPEAPNVSARLVSTDPIAREDQTESNAAEAPNLSPSTTIRGPAAATKLSTSTTRVR